MTDASIQLKIVPSHTTEDKIALDKIHLEEIDVNMGLFNIPTPSVTESSELIYATATVILETLGYKIE